MGKYIGPALWVGTTIPRELRIEFTLLRLEHGTFGTRPIADQPKLYGLSKSGTDFPN